MRNLVITLLLSITFSSYLFCINELSIKDNASHGARQGYIDKATLVIEPFGSYVEESLYLEYSDRHEFNVSPLEIVHRFELPTGSSVNDMWLWIGDSIMQAILLDTWTARSIYDSIVATKYDPGFLSKTGSQYELRIYPLTSGQRRKVKITFVVPAKWYGKQSTAEIPLKMLLASKSAVKPLDILFRRQNDEWGQPSLLESPQTEFVDFIDTLGFHFQKLHLDDITGLPSLNLKYDTDFNNGYYINGYEDKTLSTYFQLGVIPSDFYNVSSDTNTNKVLVALDFSGSSKKNLIEELPKYKALVDSSLKDNDSFKLIISGNQQIVNISDTYLNASSENIDTVFTEFIQSDLAKAIDQVYKKNVLFCDWDASNNWNFTNLSEIANVKELNNIILARPFISNSDVVAAYRHGFDETINPTTAALIIESLDSLFAGGGRFLTYYDYNRENGEILARHYIQGLKVKLRVTTAVTLYRNPDGNIGMGFPESFTRNACYFLDYTDPDVKVELRDISGNAAVISKKVKNGLIVVTGMWSLRDDNALKSMLGAALIGANAASNPFVLNNLLTKIKEQYTADKFNKVILLSDSDSLISKNDAEFAADQYISGYTEGYPKFLTVNLLNNDLFIPSYILDDGIEYYGSGFFLKTVTDRTKGIFIEKHLYDWPYIASVFSPFSTPFFNDMRIETVVDNGSGELYELREVNKLADPNKPRFFLGRSNAQGSIKFNVLGRFEGTETDSAKEITFLVPHDTTRYNKIIKAMLGLEKINDLFKVSPIDTATIVTLALDYHLLTNFTALLAIEPNDTVHFMKDPFDEGELTAISDFLNEESDTAVISVYPNPFNSMATIRLYVKDVSKVNAAIYNILGQKVADIANIDEVSGEKLLTWDAKNNYGTHVSSGFYILRVIVTDKNTRKENVYTHKLLQLK